MKHGLIIIGALALAACNGDGEATRAATSCEVLQSIDASRSETIPFSSLRGEPRTMGDAVLEGQYMATQSPFGASCEINAMDRFFGTDTTLHLYSCRLYERLGSLDREARGTEARAIFDEARDSLTECLGPDWEIDETTENANFEVYSKIKLTPPEGAAQIADFTADTMFLTLAYSPFMNHPDGGSGWRVQYQVQQPSQ